ncbi:hypothetical protein DM02DRAFT_620785 [Periconia macrospinosa]|uniref:Heterokaryon incompatibility domain-containing protein n=1 Tax=Periconia macrospinosa TaxID=97972 RepID=A0A2V1CYW9_9PLEO|nr:hypothetical protein DM02DRAFT_620785 [Periconia macrospinosa]
MRLLRRSNDGEFSLTTDLLSKDEIPPYAILSHTWGADTEEVTFKDLTNGAGKDKPGYERLRLLLPVAPFIMSLPPLPSLAPHPSLASISRRLAFR